MSYLGYICYLLLCKKRRHHVMLGRHPSSHELRLLICSSAFHSTHLVVYINLSKNNVKVVDIDFWINESLRVGLCNYWETIAICFYFLLVHLPAVPSWRCLSSQTVSRIQLYLMPILHNLIPSPASWFFEVAVVGTLPLCGLPFMLNVYVILISS